MQLNKLILLLLFFSSYFINGQPSATKNNYARIKIVVKDSTNKPLEFITKDSLFFFTNEQDYQLTLSIFRTNYNSSKDSIIEKLPIYLCKENHGKFGGLYSFYKEETNYEIFYILSKKNIYNENPQEYYYKSIVEIYMKHDEKSMNIKMDFTKKEINKYIELKDLNIIFKEGFFEITDPENPKLIAIKKDN